MSLSLVLFLLKLPATVNWGPILLQCDHIFIISVRILVSNEATFWSSGAWCLLGGHDSIPISWLGFYALCPLAIEGHVVTPDKETICCRWRSWQSRAVWWPHPSKWSSLSCFQRGSGRLHMTEPTTQAHGHFALSFACFVLNKWTLSIEIWINCILYFTFFFFFWWYWAWTQGLTLLGRHSTTWSTLPTVFYSSKVWSFLCSQHQSVAYVYLILELLSDMKDAGCSKGWCWEPFCNQKWISLRTQSTQ
jgi:hypothetical protein